MTRNEAIREYKYRLPPQLWDRREKMRNLLSAEFKTDIFGDYSVEVEITLNIFLVKDIADQFKYDTHSVF